MCTNTRPFGEVGGKSPLQLYLLHILLKLKIKTVLGKNSSWIFFISNNNLFSGLRFTVVVECLTRDRVCVGSSLTGATALRP